MGMICIYLSIYYCQEFGPDNTEQIVSDSMINLMHTTHTHFTKWVYGISNNLTEIICDLCVCARRYADKLSTIFLRFDEQPYNTIHFI